MKSSDSSFDETKIFDEDTSKDRRTNLEVDRARRAKKRMAAQRLEELGMSGDEALSWLIDLDNYLPDPNCLTLGEGLKERFEAALKEQASLKNRLFFRHSEASSYDALSDVNKVFYGSKTLESLCDSEADLMFGMATADRYGAAYLKAAEEMFALKDLALAEVVRRRTLADCARYRLPKPFITMHAVLVAAGMKRDDYRFQTSFFQKFIDLVIEEAESEVDREVLIETARGAEEQFVGFGSDEFGRDHSQPSEAGSVDPKPQPIDETIDVEAITSPEHDGALAVDLDREIERLDAEVRHALDRGLYVPEDDRPYPSLIKRNLLKGLKSGEGELRADGSVVIGSMVVASNMTRSGQVTRPSVASTCQRRRRQDQREAFHCSAALVLP